MNNIIEQLQLLGLTEKQARVYLALVELGRGTAYAIAKKANVKRPTVYVILDELRLKSLVLKIPHSKKQIFIAKNPQDFFKEQEEKLESAKQALPKLLARIPQGDRVKTYFFEGREGIKQALYYGLEALTGKELVCYYAKSTGGKIPEVYFDYSEKLCRQKTKIRALVPDHLSLVKFRHFEKSPMVTTIILPEAEFSPKVSVEIAESFVRILLHQDQQALIVENKNFAEMMKQVFEMVWKTKTR